MNYTFLPLPPPGAVYRWSRPWPGVPLSSLGLLMLCYLLALVGLDSLRDSPWWPATVTLKQVIQVVAAALALWAASYWLLAPAPARGRNCCAQAATGFAAAFLWSLLWLTLPFWAFLKVVGFGVGVPWMALQWWRRGARAQAWGAVAGWAVAFGLLAVFLTWGDGARLTRLLNSVWPAVPDVFGQHFQWAQVQHTLAELAWLGTAPQGFELSRVLSYAHDDAGWLLRLGAQVGLLPMGLLGVGAVLAWGVLALWMRRSPAGLYLSLRARRLGVALAMLHALAAALYVVWSFGGLYSPMGALGLFSHEGWGVLHLAAAWLAWRALQQRAAHRSADTRALVEMLI